jgi:hypothetical protein
MTRANLHVSSDCLFITLNILPYPIHTLSPFENLPEKYPHSNAQSPAIWTYLVVVTQAHLRSRCSMARTVLERTHLFQTGTQIGVVRMLRDYLAQDVDCG